MFTPSEAWGVVGEATGCSSHSAEVPFTEEDILVVFWYDYGCNCASLSEQRKREEAEAARKLAEAASTPEGLDDVDTFDRGGRGAICGGYCDTWSEAYFQLRDGRFVTASETSDSSGHG